MLPLQEAADSLGGRKILRGRRDQGYSRRARPKISSGHQYRDWQNRVGVSADRAESWGGVLSTAGGLVFVADDSGALSAVDAEKGEPLWSFRTNQFVEASPMT